MPFGRYTGTLMANVPARYLLWLYENDKAGKVKQYIIDNLDVIKEEIRRQNSNS